MRSRHPSSRGPGVALALALSLAASAGCTSTPSRTPSVPATSSPRAPSPSVRPTPAVPVGQAVRLVAPAGGTFVVHGTYPKRHSACVHPHQPALDARYPGTLNLVRQSDGSMTVTVALPFERYLDGLAEVPASWPSAALQAQVIAARSYALAQTGWTGAPHETLHHPICATASCQVYGGLPVTPSPDYARWLDAVRATTGQVLLYGGRPADTVYSSTSNGHTYGNDVVFGSAPLPYLRPRIERDDGASPESHWQAHLPLGDLARFLRAAGDWPARPAISTVTKRGQTIVVSGHGVVRRLDVDTFDADVNPWSHCLEPARYPGPSSNGATLPVTIPSHWFSAATRGGAAVLIGRGWGHGVGMVQWGAYGKAKRGWSDRQILAFYYGGLTPKRFPEPGTIVVQVAQGLSSLTITPSGPGATVDGRPIAAGSVRVSGGAVLIVTPSNAPQPAPSGPTPP